MPEPASIKERMEALGWRFEVDYDCDGEKLIAEAIKLGPPDERRVCAVIGYHNEQAYRNDHAACRAAWMAEWERDGQ